jgi:hypothetical protein
LFQLDPDYFVHWWSQLDIFYSSNWVSANWVSSMVPLKTGQEGRLSMLIFLNRSFIRNVNFSVYLFKPLFLICELSCAWRSARTWNFCWLDQFKKRVERDFGLVPRILAVHCILDCEALHYVMLCNCTPVHYVKLQCTTSSKF